MLLVQRDVLYNAFDLMDQSFENINSIFRTFFQEPQDVLIFTVSVTIYISSVKEWTLSWGSSCKVVTRYVFHGVLFTFFVFWAYFVESIIFNKIKVSPVILRKKTKSAGLLSLNIESLKWVFAKGNLLSNNLCFWLSFDYLYRKCKALKNYHLFLILMKRKHFKFQFPYRFKGITF